MGQGPEVSVEVRGQKMGGRRVCPPWRSVSSEDSRGERKRVGLDGG